MCRTGLAYVYETEGYIQQSYESCSFELIQNARDANQLDDEAGCIWFSLGGGVLRVVNIGIASPKRIIWQRGQEATKWLLGYLAKEESCYQFLRYIIFYSCYLQTLQISSPKLLRC